MPSPNSYALIEIKLAEPRTVMNSRRLIRSPRRRGQGASWNLEAESLRGGEIDDKRELRRLLDWNVAWLRPAQNFVDEFGGTPELIREVWTVGHECSGLDKFAGIDDCRQPRAQRKRDDASTVGLNECIAHNV